MQAECNKNLFFKLQRRSLSYCKDKINTLKTELVLCRAPTEN